VCGGVGIGVCFSLFMISARFWRGRLCFVRGRGVVLYISLFLRMLGLGVCVCACIRAHIHTNYLGT